MGHVYRARNVVSHRIEALNVLSPQLSADQAFSATKIGKLLGVDTIIVGDITQFGRDDKNTDAGGVGGVLGHYGLGGVGVHKSKAVVGITARMVDVNTGEILASVTGAGESSRSGSDLAGGGASGWSGGAGARSKRPSASSSLPVLTPIQPRELTREQRLSRWEIR